MPDKPKRITSPKPPLEKDIEKAVCDWAKKQGCYVRKFTSPANRSVPDRIFVLPHGTVCFIEFKAPGKKPTTAQEKEIALLEHQGAHVIWSDDADESKHWIHRLLYLDKTSSFFK